MLVLVCIDCGKRLSLCSLLFPCSFSVESLLAELSLFRSDTQNSGFPLSFYGKVYSYQAYSPPFFRSGVSGSLSDRLRPLVMVRASTMT
mmetsp:Transcript_27917/g.65278  ORF Transcript_27917/g.65278 Transcript_27917/m.65278 type:complete len:89 (-) Transcript_27917:749-1015(-)